MNEKIEKKKNFKLYQEYDDHNNHIEPKIAIQTTKRMKKKERRK